MKLFFLTNTDKPTLNLCGVQQTEDGKDRSYKVKKKKNERGSATRDHRQGKGKTDRKLYQDKKKISLSDNRMSCKM